MTLSYTYLRKASLGLRLQGQRPGWLACCYRPVGMLAMLLMSLPALAQTASVSSLSPVRNAKSVARNTNVTVILSSPPTGPASALTVWSQQAGGKKAGTASISGNALSFNPSTDFKPGEVVYATTTTASGLAKAQVYQFTTAAAAAPATFLGGSNVEVGSGPYSVAVGDVDGDGDLDFLAANSNTNTVSVRLNDGSGNFSGGSNVGVGSVPASVAVGDVDGDGDLDLLTANFNSDNVSVRLNDGSGNFSGGSEVGVGSGPYSVALGDLDGDGDLDFLTANSKTNTVSVRLNAGSGTFNGGSEVRVNGQPYSVAVGDVDGDGDLDILSAANNGSNTVNVRLNAGSGSFSGGSDVGVGSQPQSVAVGDVDGDGDLDLLTANLNSDNVSVRLNDGSGSFSGGSDVGVGSQPVSVAVGDVDGDGDLDFLAANQSSANVSVRLNDGSGNFSGTTNVGVGSQPVSVALGDVDGDGDLDILAPNYRSANVSVRLNQLPPVAITVSPASATVCAGANTSFSVMASNATSYQWQVNSGSGFTDLSNTALYSGVTSATLTLTGATTALSGYQYRVVVSGATSATSTVATLTVNALPTAGLTNNGPLTCSQTSVTLTASPSGQSNYVFSAGVTRIGMSNQAIVSKAGTYSVVITSAGGCTASATTTVQSNTTTLTLSNPAVSTATVGVAFSQSFTATGGTSPYSFSVVNSNLPATFSLSSAGVLSGTPTQVGSYTLLVQAQDANGCAGVASTAYSLTVGAAISPIRHVRVGGTGSGNSWADASGDLQSQINFAGAQQVWVAAGTYKPTSGTDRTISFAMKNGVAIYGGFPATGDPSLAQRNPASLTTTLSGDIGTPVDNTDNSYHVINNLLVLNNAAVLDGFVVTSGNATGTGGNTDRGGGMYNENSGSPALINCSFIGNRATFGGAVFNFNSSPALTNCTIQSNTATTNGGGMVNLSSSNAILTNCSFSNNTAANGGALNNSGSSLILTSCVFFGNGGQNTTVGSVAASYSLFETGESDYSGSNNLTTATSPFESAGSVALNACSPAINAGNPASVTVANGPYSATALPPIDLAGNPRIVGGRVDMGAVEFQGTPNTTLAITQQPPSGSAVCGGGSVSAAVSVSGTGPYTYQWYKNSLSSPVQSQTTTTLSLSNVQTADAGSYSVVVTGACGSVTSTAFTLTVSGLSPDYQPLVDLYNSTNGPGWKNHTGWTQGCDPCTGNNGSPWFGVSCANGRVSSLNLTSNQLSGSIPASLSALTNLQNLRLDFNQLSGSIPASLSALTNLQYLLLNSNQLSGSIPASLSALTNLQYLQLNNNQLSGPIPASLGALTKLQDLQLNNNQLSGSIPASLSALTKLQYLYLYINQLSGCFPASLSALCGGGRDISFSNNPGLPGNGDFAAFCASGAGSDAFTAQATASPTTLNVGQTTSLTATGGTAYRWQAPGGLTLSSTTGSVISATATSPGVQTLTVVVSNGGSCTATAMVSLTINEQPATAAPVVTTPADGSLLNTTTPTYAGTAPASSTVTVLVDGNPIGTTTATAGNSFSLVQPTALSQGSHTVRATAQASGQAISVASNTNTFTVDTSSPTVSITPASATLTCASPSVSLTAVGTGTVRWEDNSTNAVRTVRVAGTYSVTLTSANGNTDVASAQVFSNTAVPALSIAPASATLTCTSPSVSLTALGTGTVRWDDNSTSTVRPVNTAGTYSVTLTGTNGCTATATTTVQSSTVAPTAGLTASGTLTCATTSVTLTASPAGQASYAFSAGATQIGTSNQATVSQTGTYSVTVTNGAGCSAVAQVTVTGSTTAPSLVVNSPTNPSSCSGSNGSISFTTNLADGPYSLTYTGSGSPGTVTVSSGAFSLTGLSAGSYSNFAISSNGCVGTAAGPVTLTAPTAPTIMLSNNGPLTCATTSVTLTASPAGASYVFSQGANQLGGSTGNTATVDRPGMYSVVVTSATGCTAAATTTVMSSTTAPDAPLIATQRGHAYPGGVSSLTVAQNTGDVVLMVSGCSGGTLTWSGGASSTLSVSSANTGVQTFTATCTSNGCTSLLATATITVVAPTLTVLSRDPDNGQLNTNTLKPYLQLKNQGTTPVPYGELTVRYWLTVENPAPLRFDVNYAQMGNDKVRFAYVPLSPARPGATGYIEFSFDPSAGSLAPGSDAVIQDLVNKQDYSMFFQGDDYSYVNNANFAPNPHITAYQNGGLIYGQEPGGGSTTPPANTPPTATPNPNQTATQGVSFSYTIAAFGDAETPNALTYTASINPANGFTFNPGTRVIQGAPGNTGVSSVTITATDPGGLAASTTFTITVNAVSVVSPTALSLTASASPAMILTTGTTTLSAMVSGGTRPYRYSFTGPGTITPSDSTASVTGLMAGVQTFTLTVTDASQPVSQRVSATVSVSVTAPVVGPTTLTVLSRDPDNGQLNTNTLKPYLQLKNQGTTPIPYGELTVRYWLTVENPAPLRFDVNYAQMGNDKVRFAYVPLSPARPGATGYIEFSFDPSAGSLAPGSDAVIQDLVNKQDYSMFFQGDDYSYVNNPNFAPNPHITAYQNGGLIYGQEPPVAASGRQGVTETAEPLRVRVLNNPLLADEIVIEVTGAADESLHLVVTDLLGHTLSDVGVDRAGVIERQHLAVGHPSAGVLVLQVSTPTQSQTVKVLKVN